MALAPQDIHCFRHGFHFPTCLTSILCTAIAPSLQRAINECIVLLFYDIATNDTFNGMWRIRRMRLLDRTFVNDLAIFVAGALFFFYNPFFSFHFLQSLTIREPHLDHTQGGILGMN